MGVRITILCLFIFTLGQLHAQTIAEVKMEFVDSADYSGPVIHAFEHSVWVKKRKQRKIKRLIEQSAQSQDWKNSIRRKKVRRMSRVIRKRGIPTVLWEKVWTVADMKATEHVIVAKINGLLGVTFQYKDTTNNTWVNLEWRYSIKEESPENWIYGKNYFLHSFNISTGNPKIDRPAQKESGHPLIKDRKLNHVRPQHIVGQWKLDSIQKLYLESKVVNKVESYDFSKYFKWQKMKFKDGKDGVIYSQRKSGASESVPFVFRLQDNTLKIIESRTRYVYYIIEELDENQMVLMAYSSGIYLFHQRMFFSKEVDEKYSYLEFQQDQKSLVNPKMPKEIDVHALDRVGSKYYYYPGGDEKKAVLYSGLVTMKNNKGGKAMEEPIVNGVIEGTKKVWTMSGALLGEYEYKNGKKEGLQINYFENGDTSLMHYNVAGKMDGLYCRWNEYDILLETGNLKEGQKDGTWKYYDTKGRLIKEELFENKQLVSHVNSPPGENSVMFLDLEEKNGLYHLNNKLFSGKAYQYFPESYGYRVRFANLINGLRHGEEVEIYTSGKIAEMGVNISGNKDGAWLSFHYSGDTAAVEHYLKGEQTGEWRKYGNNGKLHEQKYFLRGELNGPYKKWSYEGKVSEEGSYYKGKRDGTWREYYSKGALFSEQNYDKGEFIGTWSKWEENGRLKEECIYVWSPSDVVCDCKMKSAGNTWLKGRKINHVKEGEWKVINNNGDIVKRLYYRRGQIQK